MDKYFIRIQHIKTGKVKEHKALPVKTSIEHIIKVFGNYGWGTIEYYQVYDDSESIEVACNTSEV